MHKAIGVIGGCPEGLLLLDMLYNIIPFNLDERRESMNIYDSFRDDRRDLS